MRDEIRDWRSQGYPGTALVTRRLLEWWFERDEERKAMGKRFFFCQQETIEAVIYLYEVQNRRKLPETGDLLRYALKLATGTGKTVVMAMLVTWSTLHKRKVSGSTLSTNFLVLVPNLTVRDRVSGVPRGDGLEPGGDQNLYKEFDMVPPEYLEEFHPNIMVRNWQSIPLEAKRDDWIGEEVLEEGRETQGVIPDIVTMAKGIGNGCPLGAVVTTPQIAATLQGKIHFNTFGGNPVVSAMGKAVLEVIEKEKLQANALKIGGSHSGRAGQAEGETQNHRRRARQGFDARHRNGERPRDEGTRQGRVRAGVGKRA